MSAISNMARRVDMVRTVTKDSVAQQSSAGSTVLLNHPAAQPLELENRQPRPCSVEQGHDVLGTTVQPLGEHRCQVGDDSRGEALVTGQPSRDVLGTPGHQPDPGGGPGGGGPDRPVDKER